MAKPTANPKPDENSLAVETETPPANAAPIPAEAPAAAPAEPAPAAAPPREAEPLLTLEEWCGRKSEAGTKPVPLSVFANEEAQVGHDGRDTATAFEQRFQAMLQRPTR